MFASYSQTPCMKSTAALLAILLFITVGLIIAFNRISMAAPRPYARHQTAQQMPQTIGQVPLPQGYTRIAVPNASFAAWLRNFKLRNNNTVYFYNGQPVPYQNWHYAVLDLSTGSKDLQQCADAIMRMRAEYYFATEQYHNIVFGEGRQTYSFDKYLANIEATSDQHGRLLGFMETVFINCGTYTVNAMSNHIPIDSMQPGDMFVHAGSPGHAMLVVDVAQNAQGQKIYLLAQSYMPAQDMHIVVNPANANLSPWYTADKKTDIVTPGYVFSPGELKRWKPQPAAAR
jgi:hypothetical protein